MKAAIPVLCIALMTTVATAQEQQAGNAASTDTEGTFQALVDACDDVDALMLRARIRLQLPRPRHSSCWRPVLRPVLAATAMAQRPN